MEILPEEQLFVELVRINEANRPELVYILGKDKIFFSGCAVMVKSFGLNVINFLDRGEILEAFTHIEALLNEIIRRHFGISLVNSSIFTELLDNIDMFNKIRQISDWNIIDQSTREIMYQLKKVRNLLAHHWANSFQYKGRPVVREADNNFLIFQADFNKVWFTLVDKLSFVQQPAEQLLKELAEIK